MSRLLSDVASWYWWVSVVVVGILINLASAYLKTPIDRFLGRWSAKRRLAAAARETEMRRQADLIAASPELLALEVRGEAIGVLLSVFIVALLAATLGLAALVRSAFPESALPQKIVIVVLLAFSATLLVFAHRALSVALSHTRRIAYVRHHLRKRRTAG